MIPTWTARARYAYGEYCVRKDSHSMIPTRTDHARELGRCVRFAHKTAIVRAVRYVAHLSATFQSGHPSPAQEPPMTSLQERHEADQDDADRFTRASIEPTYWNGLPTIATRGTAIVADAPQFPGYWAKRVGILGQRIPVVQVVLDGVNYGGGIDYLDNRSGQGWAKVTTGHGSARYGHAGVAIVADSFEPTP